MNKPRERLEPEDDGQNKTRRVVERTRKVSQHQKGADTWALKGQCALSEAAPKSMTGTIVDCEKSKI